MKNYEDVLKTMKECKTITAHITSLGKIRAKTEDTNLLKRLDEAIGSLQGALAHNQKGKSIPRSLDRATDQALKNLIAYCEAATVSKKPEWQVIAKKNGWAPKT
jgi:hypothetical protein